ncbi:serine/arginine-rich splicing factor 9-like [Discoglossus pictus]
MADYEDMSTYQARVHLKVTYSSFKHFDKNREDIDGFLQNFNRQCELHKIHKIPSGKSSWIEVESKFAAHQMVVHITFCAGHHSGEHDILKVLLANQNIVYTMPVLVTRMHPDSYHCIVDGEAARAGSGNGRIYVGNLPADVREKELEELFHRYGRIRSVELKNRGRCSSSPFAFIKFQDPRDAEDAVFDRNGYDFGSCRLRVEFPRHFRGSRGDGGGYGAPRGRNGPPSRRSDFRVLVSGLPPSGSWQDLKDHMRKAGDVCYADVHKDGMGIVEFIRKEDMEYALRKLDDTKFRSHEGENYYIRVCPERNASYSRSRSRSRGHDSPYQSRRSPSPLRPY